MASVLPQKATISLWANPTATILVIPALTAMQTTTEPETTFVRFAGDTYPTAFDGEGEDWQLTLTCMYERAKQDDLNELLYLLRHRTRDVTDKRLLLRTHAGIVPGLNPTIGVRQAGPLSVDWKAAVVTVQIPVRVVEHSVYV